MIPIVLFIVGSVYLEYGAALGTVVILILGLFCAYPLHFIAYLFLGFPYFLGLCFSAYVLKRDIRKKEIKGGFLL